VAPTNGGSNVVQSIFIIAIGLAPPNERCLAAIAARADLTTIEGDAPRGGRAKEWTAMGIFDQSSLTKQNPATVLVPEFQIHCTLHSVGMMQTFLNDDLKPTLTLHEASMLGLRRGNPATSMSLPELYVRKDQCHALAFEQLFSQEETGLMP